MAYDTPPKLTPPGTTQADGAVGSRFNPWLLLGSLLLLLLALGVIWILPKLVTPRVETVPAGEPATAQGESARSRLLHEKGLAESALERLLRRRAELESQSISIWAGTEYEAALQPMASADEALAAGRFAEAMTGYRESIQALDQLEQSREERYLRAMSAGSRALERLDANAAQLQFRIALAIRPEEREAQQGLARSQSIEQVAALTRKGEEQAQQGRWQEAVGYYRQAVKLDDLYQPARDGLEGALSMQREQAFHGAMSALLNALDGQDYRAADQALESAAKLKPGAPELADARRRLADGRKRNRLLRLRSSARKAVAGEEWVEASKLYAEALKLDPDAAFARDGLQTARQRLKLQQRIEGYIRHPDRLQSDQPLADARSLLHHLEAVADPGPKLRAAEEELARLVAVAGSKVVVRIHSDEATEVVIYRVGRFGKFLRREVELRPGSYTLVGSRAGYRDVRRTLEVQPGPGIDVVVRCEERI